MGPHAPAVGACDVGALLPQVGQGHAGAAAELLHHGDVRCRLHDVRHAVLQGEDKAGGKGPGVRAGVHHRGGVGEELEASHHAVEGFLGLRQLEVGCAVAAVRGCDGPGDATEHAAGVLHGLELVVLHEVAVSQDAQGVFREVGALALLRASQALGVQGAHDACPAGAARGEGWRSRFKLHYGRLQRRAHSGLRRLRELGPQVGQRRLSFDICARTKVNHESAPSRLYLLGSAWGLCKPL